MQKEYIEIWVMLKEVKEIITKENLIGLGWNNGDKYLLAQ